MLIPMNTIKLVNFISNKYKTFVKLNKLLLL